MRKRKNLLVIVLIAVLAAGLLIAGLLSRHPSGDSVLITVGGQEYGRYPLGQKREVVISLGHGEENILVIDEEGFYMKSATCRDQLCVGQGKVTRSNASLRMLGPDIICLPHRVVVTLVTNDVAVDSLDGV